MAATIKKNQTKKVIKTATVKPSKILSTKNQAKTKTKKTVIVKKEKKEQNAVVSQLEAIQSPVAEEKKPAVGKTKVKIQDGEAVAVVADQPKGPLTVKIVTNKKINKETGENKIDLRGILTAEGLAPEVEPIAKESEAGSPVEPTTEKTAATGQSFIANPAAKIDNIYPPVVASSSVAVPAVTTAPVSVAPIQPTVTAQTPVTQRSYGIYKKMAVSFVALTVILLAVIVYFSFINLSIVVIPNEERKSNNMAVQIFDQAKNQIVNEKMIVGLVTQQAVEETKNFTVSGSEILGQEIVGKITIINNYTKNQPLVATTRFLSSDGKLFRLKNTVSVPAGGRIIAEVYADEAREEMAIGPSRFTIPGLWSGLQDQIYGQSDAPMQFNQKLKRVIKQNDIDNSLKLLKGDLLTAARQEIGDIYGQEYSQILMELDGNSIKQNISGKVGEEKNEFSITIKALVNVIAFNDEKIYEIAKEKLIASLDGNKQLIQFDKANITYTLNNYDLEAGTAGINVNFEGQITLKQDVGFIDREKLVGLTKDQIANYLKTFPEIAGFEIKFSPSFINKAPYWIDQIKIGVKQ